MERGWEYIWSKLDIHRELTLAGYAPASYVQCCMGLELDIIGCDRIFAIQRKKRGE